MMRSYRTTWLPILIAVFVVLTAMASSVHAEDGTVPVPAVAIKVAKTPGNAWDTIALGTTNWAGDVAFMYLPSGEYVVSVFYQGAELKVWGDPHVRDRRITVSNVSYGRAAVVPTAFTAPLGEIDAIIEVHGSTLVVKIRKSARGAKDRNTRR